MKTIIAIILLSASALAQCGNERWDVKTLKDKYAKAVKTEAIKKTVKELVKYQAPIAWSNSLQRQSPIEFNQFVVEANLIAFKKESDQDYHLVIADKTNNKITMIAEIPAPECTGKTIPYKQLRATIDSLHKASAKLYTLSKPIPIEITGVGFFDKPHGQDGLAPNGIELHPVTRLEIKK